LTHSTYHCGQVVSIGWNLGYTDAPMTDYNFYKMVLHLLEPIASASEGGPASRRGSVEMESKVRF